MGEIKRHDWSERNSPRVSQGQVGCVAGIEQIPLHLQVDVSQVAEDYLSIGKSVLHPFYLTNCRVNGQLTDHKTFALPLQF